MTKYNYDNLQNYSVEIDLPSGVTPDTPVTGSGVDDLTVEDVEPIGDCVLTPGDPSPVGRCPRTGDLVYLDRPEDRMRDAAPDLLEALKIARPRLHQHLVSPEQLTLIDAAIAKARGEG